MAIFFSFTLNFSFARIQFRFNVCMHKVIQLFRFNVSGNLLSRNHRKGLLYRTVHCLVDLFYNVIKIPAINIQYLFNKYYLTLLDITSDCCQVYVITTIIISFVNLYTLRNTVCPGMFYRTN